jgi:hypothetical protein
VKNCRCSAVSSIGKSNAASFASAFPTVTSALSGSGIDACVEVPFDARRNTVETLSAVEMLT